jgi:hypothetical protein
MGSTPLQGKLYFAEYLGNRRWKWKDKVYCEVDSIKGQNLMGSKRQKGLE